MESIGIAERAERILILLVASLIAFAWVPALWWSVVLLAFLTNITVLQRVIYFYGAVKKKTAV
jgi:phosphatidylglycerophosphate synthase